jgi:phage terminase large subunit-like protein
VTITTAGDALARETSILGRLIDGNERDGIVERPHAGLTISRNHGSRSLIYNYSAPTIDPSDVPAMKLANPASWITAEFLAQQAASPELTTAEVLQLHGCVWAQSLDVWIPDEAWSGCFGGANAIPDGARVIAGVDVGQRHDHSAVVFAWKDMNDRIVLRARVWEPGEDGRSRVLDVEKYLREASERYELAAIVYDERFFNRSAEVLSEEGLLLVDLEQSSKAMSDAYQGFYQAALEHRLSHDGGILSQHVRGCAAEMTERGWRVRKLRQSQKIDACVAAVMATYWLEREVEKPVYRSAGFA